MIIHEFLNVLDGTLMRTLSIDQHSVELTLILVFDSVFNFYLYFVVEFIFLYEVLHHISPVGVDLHSYN